MPKWESTITSADMPVYMYKLSKSYVERIGEDICKKGVNVKGIILYKDWYSFRQEQSKLTELISGNSAVSYIDYRVYSISKNKVLYEKVESSEEFSEVLNLEDQVKKNIDKSVKSKAKKK